MNSLLLPTARQSPFDTLPYILHTFDTWCLLMTHNFNVQFVILQYYNYRTDWLACTISKENNQLPRTRSTSFCQTITNRYSQIEGRVSTLLWLSERRDRVHFFISTTILRLNSIFNSFTFKLTIDLLLQLTSAALDTKLREDLERLKKIRAHRGVRHFWGLRVRGQHTKTTGRRGRTVGVSKKK